MTENAKRIFNFLKENHGEKFTCSQICQALEVKPGAVTGTVTGLVKKGYAIREDAVTTDSNGKEVTVKYIYLTDAGCDYDPDAVAEKAE